MSRCSQEKVNMMKSSKTGHLTDSAKEKMKHASIFIKDKEEVVNKRYLDGRCPLKEHTSSARLSSCFAPIKPPMKCWGSSFSILKELFVCKILVPEAPQSQGPKLS